MAAGDKIFLGAMLGEENGVDGYYKPVMKTSETLISDGLSQGKMAGSTIRVVVDNTGVYSVTISASEPGKPNNTACINKHDKITNELVLQNENFFNYMSLDEYMIEQDDSYIYTVGGAPGAYKLYRTSKATLVSELVLDINAVTGGDNCLLLVDDSHFYLFQKGWSPTKAFKIYKVDKITGTLSASNESVTIVGTTHFNANNDYAVRGGFIYITIGTEMLKISTLDLSLSFQLSLPISTIYQSYSQDRAIFSASSSGSVFIYSLIDGSYLGTIPSLTTGSVGISSVRHSCVISDKYAVTYISDSEGPNRLVLFDIIDFKMVCTNEALGANFPASDGIKVYAGSNFSHYESFEISKDVKQISSYVKL